MDHIIFEIPFSRSEFIESYKFRYRLNTRKFRRNVKVFLIGSIVYCIIGFIVFVDERLFNPFILFGLAFITISLLFYFLGRIVKGKFLRKIIAEADRFEEQSLVCKYDITPDSVKYTDNEKSLEYKWSIFSSYSKVNDQIILLIDDSFLQGFAISKSEISTKDFDLLLLLVESKLTFRKAQ